MKTKKQKTKKTKKTKKPNTKKTQKHRYFRIRDAKFNIYTIDKFRSDYICEKPKIEGGHSFKIACYNQNANDTIEYFLKIMSIPNYYNNDYDNDNEYLSEMKDKYEN